MGASAEGVSFDAATVLSDVGGSVAKKMSRLNGTEHISIMLND